MLQKAVAAVKVGVAVGQRIVQRGLGLFHAALVFLFRRSVIRSQVLSHVFMRTTS